MATESLYIIRYRKRGQERTSVVASEFDAEEAALNNSVSFYTQVDFETPVDFETLAEAVTAICNGEDIDSDESVNVKTVHLVSDEDFEAESEDEDSYDDEPVAGIGPMW